MYYCLPNLSKLPSSWKLSILLQYFWVQSNSLSFNNKRILLLTQSRLATYNTHTVRKGLRIYRETDRCTRWFKYDRDWFFFFVTIINKVAQLLRSAACLHPHPTRSYFNHLVFCVYYVNKVTIVQLERKNSNLQKLKPKSMVSIHLYIYAPHISEWHLKSSAHSIEQKPEETNQTAKYQQNIFLGIGS
jgi:hypothetical protein